MGGSVPYLVAGFGLTWAVVILYAWRLEARLGRARDRLRRREEREREDRVRSPGAGSSGGPGAIDDNEGAEATR